jgi:hypothetical protein
VSLHHRFHAAFALRLADMTPVWEHKDFQDRTVLIWEHLARVRRSRDPSLTCPCSPYNSRSTRGLPALDKSSHDRLVVLVATSLTPLQHYKNNTWVAGYNPLNEPTDSEHTRLIAFYQRVEKAIRAIDPHHILFLE